MNIYQKLAEAAVDMTVIRQQAEAHCALRSSSQVQKHAKSMFDEVFDESSLREREARLLSHSFTPEEAEQLLPLVGHPAFNLLRQKLFYYLLQSIRLTEEDAEHLLEAGLASLDKEHAGEKAPQGLSH